MLVALDRQSTTAYTTQIYKMYTFWSERSEESNHMPVMGINGRVILKCISEKQCIYWIQLAQQVPTINFREHDDKPFV